MKRTLVKLLFLACSLATASAASAQESAAELRGRVLDAQDAVLPGVKVTITNLFSEPIWRSIRTISAGIPSGCPFACRAR
jgi:hypothetical protein